MTKQFEFKFPTYEKAESKRNRAMDRVEDKAGEAWSQYAVSLIRSIAQRMKRFTSDDVMVSLEQKPHDPRALGPAMKRAQKLGYIKPTTDFKPSLRRHLSPIRVWEVVA